MILPRKFHVRDPVAVARNLLGIIDRGGRLGSALFVRLDWADTGRTAVRLACVECVISWEPEGLPNDSPREFYVPGLVTVARDLLGKVLVHGRTTGRIVAVEAYLGVGDLAAHASRGLTKQTCMIFGLPGHDECQVPEHMAETEGIA
jgi:hypothetical protein